MRAGSLSWLPWSCLALLAVLTAATTGLSAMEQEPQEPSPDAPLCQLNIEGKSIRRLTLEKRRADSQFDPANRKVIDRPGPSVMLPPGEYRLQHVDLEGGYGCFPPPRIADRVTDEWKEVGWVTLSPDKPYSLKIGAPLEPTVTVFRQGRVMQVACQLLDAEGRAYSGGNPPRFAVYCNDRPVGSGTFEYG